MEKPDYAPNYLANHRRLEGEMDSARVAAAANEIKAECERLREEVRRLRQILIDHSIEPDPPVPQGEAPSSPPSLILATPQKIKLFRSLFRGRDDVYAARWESPDGRRGYWPVAQHDWTAYSAADIEESGSENRCIPESRIV